MNNNNNIIQKYSMYESIYLEKKSCWRMTAVTVLQNYCDCYKKNEILENLKLIKIIMILPDDD